MTDTEDHTDTEQDSDYVSKQVDDSMTKIHQFVEQIAHDAKQLYGKAVRLNQLVETPDMDVWVEPFKLHERARPWAKKYMVASKCSLWEVNKALLETAKKEGRIGADKKVSLTKMEAEILDLSNTEPVTIWAVLGKLPRFFL
jgi:hypothetical protein